MNKKFLAQVKQALKQPGTILAMASLIGAALLDLVPGFDIGKFDSYVQMILVVLAGLGIVSNPKDGKWFIDEDGNGIDDREEDWYKEKQKKENEDKE